MRKILLRISSIGLAMSLLLLSSMVPASAIQLRTSSIYDNGEVVAMPESYRPAGVINRFEGGIGILSNPSDIMFDNDGNLLIVDRGNNRVLKTTTDGKVLAMFCAGLPSSSNTDVSGTGTTEGTETTEGTDAENEGTTSYTQTGSSGNNEVLDIPGSENLPRDESGRIVEGTQMDYVISDGSDGSEPYVVRVIYTYLNAPEGVCISPEGDIYICDTENRRLLVYDSDYNVKAIFTQDDIRQIEELGANYNFMPQKVGVSNTGTIYVLNKSSYQGLFTMNLDGEFLGYTGATRVQSSVTDILVRIFGSAAQRQAVENKQPPPAVNLTVDGNMIYTVNTESSTTADPKRIMKINMVGSDLFPEGNYDEVEEYSTSDQEYVTVDYVDIAVDSNGIVTTIDQNLGYIVQTNQMGTIITFFGGLGNRQGQFMLPTALDVEDGTGRLFVSDSSKGSVQIFEPTDFIQKVHEASRMYFDGLYEQAYGLWLEVLKMDETYMHAHMGVGEALYGQGKNVEAMESFQYSYDYDGYDKAFAEFRINVFRYYFTPIVLSLFALIFLIAYGLIKLKRKSDDLYK